MGCPFFNTCVKKLIQQTTILTTDRFYRVLKSPPQFKTIIIIFGNSQIDGITFQIRNFIHFLNK